MNFLAHAYLSGDNPKILVGNFIGDFVKGSDLRERYDSSIAYGIELHRMIDTFTDSHPVVMNSKIRLRETYRHYAPVIVDMYYDHFLAAGWQMRQTLVWIKVHPRLDSLRSEPRFLAILGAMNLATPE